MKRKVRRKKLASKTKVVRRRREFDFSIDSSIAKEIWAVFYLALAGLTYLSYEGNLGPLGAIWKGFISPVFGYGIYLLPIIFVSIALSLFFIKQVEYNLSRIFGLILFIISSLSIVHLSVPLMDFYDTAKEGNFGGLTGFAGAFILFHIFGKSGAYVIAISLFLISILLSFQFSLASIITLFVKLFLPKRAVKVDRKSSDSSENKEEVEKKDLNIIKPEHLKRGGSMVGALKDSLSQDKEAEILASMPQTQSNQEANVLNETDLMETPWEFPPLNLLSDASLNISSDDKTLKKNANLIQEKLAQFGVEVTMNSVNVGPTVMQYTLKPHAGVKLSKITNLKSDLALALAAKGIRIEAPIPGKSMVGIEIPNDNRSTVRLRELIESKEYKEFADPLKLPIGRDVSGNPIIGSLARMPHLLIAGSTGSGKSVCVNSFLITLLYQYSPRDLRLILIDPKRVELNNYNAIPHLLTPVITEPDKANVALRWCVREMNERYKLCAENKHRNIDDYNSDNKIKRKMPYIVIVIDELADLMMTVGKEVEASVCRIAQMARAVGIHLIVATQRPSVDVITGLIKANIPARIAFTVASQIDSRTIIDTMGAEDLLGHGDMLFLPGNMGRPFRVQGAFISSKEIERVTNRVKLTMDVDYRQDITSEETAKENVPGIPPSSAASAQANDEDNLYEEAVQLVMQSRKASASYLQRRLSVGYARAARLLDLMEENGVVGPSRGAKPREVNVGE
ncbi:MAG: cell division FtsK/SpoIIIE [Candidatus Peregrinibacteria bacterium GW2011_GWA2_33_10]|nr:MAG: cell division FtsK/SpoIIIE [Candidatus Peregrinibacteria bacterium GW2011_GWA2_33_10]KKP40824.1 MAG: cell division protein FtsK, DNA segregation ATPase FtsK/SpoIIIE, S-DNA-T family [Candidatus Peregrinibacteria bacterium GW2011_GWC2_33_13]